LGVWEFEVLAPSAIHMAVGTVHVRAMKATIVSHRDLKVYQAAAALRKKIFVLSLRFPAYERYELTQQIRRASRAVCSAIGEAWRKRRFKAYWISKLSEAEQEAAEAQIWTETAEECGYISAAARAEIEREYEVVLGQLTLMAINADKWMIKPK
jgi:four helix bundle protein